MSTETDLKIMFERDGYVVCERLLTDPFLDHLIDDTLKLAGEPHRMVDPKRDIHLISGQISSMHNIADYIPWYAEWIRTDILRATAERLVGPVSDTIFNSSYFAKPAKVGMETKPHQDNSYFHFDPPKIVTAWFPIDPATSENGGLYYYRESHQLGLLRHGPIGNPGASQAILHNDRAQLKSFSQDFLSLYCGDVVFHNPLVAHGSEPNISEHRRRAFNVSFASVECQRDEAMHERYLSQLKSFLSENATQPGR